MSVLRRISAAAVFLIALAACQEDGPNPSNNQNAFPDLLQMQREACEKDGGSWGVAATKASFVCYRPTRDANQSCRAASDCEGVCLARSRTCAPVKPFLGCHQVLSNTGVVQTLCLE